MPDDEIDQLDRELSPEEKTILIRRMLGPAENWDEADSEFAMKLYGVEPNLTVIEMADLIEGTIRKFRERDEEVPESLLNVLAQLQEKSNKSPKE